MTSLLTDVMYRCQLPHRPQQRVGNPLQQVVFRLLALNLPTGRRKRPNATPIRLLVSLIADAVCWDTWDGGNSLDTIGRFDSGHRINHFKPVIASAAKQFSVIPTEAEASQADTEMQNPTSPVPATPEPPRHDCYIDQHGNCPAADTELCDLHCPYRDES